MPITKSAKKALRRSIRQETRNRVWRDKLREVVKKAVAEKSAVAVSSAYKTIDKAAKNHIIAKNKASRIKSRLAKLVK